jgi:hypothetical protein
MINSSLHQNIIAAEGGWIVTFPLNYHYKATFFFVATPIERK